MGPQDQPDFVNAAVGLLTQQVAARSCSTRCSRSSGAWAGYATSDGGRGVIDLDLVWMVGTDGR